ncbi:protein of unknown function [Kyrpidia spormannii]|uniref:Uncharacterized protein n=2 Tax=Kyrpidia spormannii TaxID=2055160 RepID=A0A6F9E1I5_9BACL|nr:protein of unknown function [Kyrpidia spormannii]CAB3390364.1 protein of unknown function [Kyrpidia spormannii]
MSTYRRKSPGSLNFAHDMNTQNRLTTRLRQRYSQGKPIIYTKRAKGGGTFRDGIRDKLFFTQVLLRAFELPSGSAVHRPAASSTPDQS